jgi:hypothetical protein
MSNNLDLTQIAPGQLNVATAINDKGGEIDAALSVLTQFNITSTNALTLTAAQIRRTAMFKFANGSPIPTAPCTVDLPAVPRGTFVIDNSMTSQPVTVRISGQAATAPQVAAGAVAVAYSDGVNVRGL